MSTPTKLPWKVAKPIRDKKTGIVQPPMIVDADDYPVAKMGGGQIHFADCDERAAFIVTAVNSHAANLARIAELEAALRELVDVEGNEHGTDAEIKLAFVKTLARAALKGGQP